MARDHLGYEYTRVDDTSRMPGEEIDDKLIVRRLGKIFKDMPHTPLAYWRSTLHHVQ
jgi:hypothetical protein